MVRAPSLQRLKLKKFVPVWVGYIILITVSAAFKLQALRQFVLLRRFTQGQLIRIQLARLEIQFLRFVRLVGIWRDLMKMDLYAGNNIEDSKMKKINLNQNGMTLIEVMIASVIVLGLSLSLMSLSTNLRKDKLRYDLSRISNRVSQNFDAAIRNPASWFNTVNYISNRTSFSCYQNASGCDVNPNSSDGFYDLVLIGAQGEKLSYDSQDLTSRLALFSERCDSNIPDRNEQCPLRYVAKWKPVCTSYPCRNAQVEIKTEMIYDFPEQAVFNPQVYNTNLVRDFVDTSVQDACRLLNGNYNPLTGKCVPKYANKSCLPFRIVELVNENGDVGCAPLYKGACNPTTEIVKGFNNSGQVICENKPVFASCANKDCVGQWGACIAGTRTYTVTSPKENAGADCAASDGTTETCSSPVDCVGSWSACSVPCGGGAQTFTQTQPAQFGGLSCLAIYGQNHGDVRSCNNQLCGVKTNCVGSWGPCNPATGLQTYNITTNASNGGDPCPVVAGTTQACPVNCVGSWGACAGTPPRKTYNVSVTAKNGGVDCSYLNGATDVAACGGGYSQCRSVGCFIAGTKVQMADGTLKNIEEVKTGDWVLSYDERTGSQRIDRVKHPVHHESRWQGLIYFEMSDGSEIVSNGVHPFYVVEKKNWHTAADVYRFHMAGENIHFLSEKNKLLKVSKIKLENKNVPVYNLEIEGISESDEVYGSWGRGHNYYANGVLVHNKVAVAEVACVVGIGAECESPSTPYPNPSDVVAYCAYYGLVAASPGACAGSGHAADETYVWNGTSGMWCKGPPPTIWD